MKKYIDYLFWKRTWFRMLFVMIPTWMIPVGYILYVLNCLPSDAKTGGNNTRELFMLMYILVFGLGMADNDNVDSPPNPFKRKTPKRFKNWVEASKYLNQEIVVECIEMPNVIGKMDSISVERGGNNSMTAFITVIGHSERFVFSRCRPKY